MAESGPAPTPEQVERFSKGDFQALTRYLGKENRVIMVAEFRRTCKILREGKIGKDQRTMYLFQRDRYFRVVQSNDARIPVGSVVCVPQYRGVEEGAGHVPAPEQVCQAELFYIPNPQIKNTEEGVIRLQDTPFPVHLDFARYHASMNIPEEQADGK